MKKKIIFLLVFCLCLSVSSVSYATDTTGDNSVSNYSYGGETQHVWYDSDDNMYDNYYRIGSTTGDIAFYIVESVVSNGKRYVVYAFYNGSSGSAYSDEGYVATYDDGHTYEQEPVRATIYDNDYRQCCCGVVKSSDLFVVDGIPIFKDGDIESIEKYKSTGDVSGATNSDAFQDAYDESVPLPHNFRIVSGNKQPISGTETYPNRFNKDIVLAWEQSDVVDNLVSDIQASFTTIHKVGSMSLETRESTSHYYDLLTSISYNGTPSMTVQIASSQLNTLRDKDGLLLSKVTFRVRNRVGKKTSNWVRVTLDLKTGVATATEESYDDSSDTGGDEYNDTTVSTDDSSGGIDVNNFLSFVRGGFGLLGDTGIIALLSSVFLYLPANVWSLIYAYIAGVIVISLFLFALKGLTHL